MAAVKTYSSQWRVKIQKKKYCKHILMLRPQRHVIYCYYSSVMMAVMKFGSKVFRSYEMTFLQASLLFIITSRLTYFL